MTGLAGLLARLPLPAALRQRLEAVTSDGAAYLGNAGIAFVIRIVGAAIAFGLQVLLARLLSLNDYGLYVTFWTWLFVAQALGGREPPPLFRGGPLRLREVLTFDGKEYAVYQDR